MGMPIDEAIAILKEHQKILNVDKGIEFCQEIEALNIAIETMCKYQKIKEIINKWNLGIYEEGGFCDVEVLEMITTIIDEVYEDGND